ncbi:hypothetical protein BGW37DRAFT_519713 [Umbelopsis sp. PMI_123]|nr:hypothetical protein BGW37DRAFT_519713 [Umbelopsis sp. PMI_123]
MTTKHFKLDPTILKALNMTSISVDRESGKSSLNSGKRKRLDRNLYPDMPLAPENPWLDLFDLQTFGVDEHTSLSMTTDDFGVCISIGDENEQDIEEEGDEEEGGEEEGDEEDDGDYGDEEGTEQDGEENVDADEELEKLNALPLAWILREVDYIGVDSGLKSVVTAVRSDDLNDKLEISSGYWKTCRLDKAFNQADNQKRESSGVTGALESLSNINRDDYDGWKYYLQVYYTNFDVLHSWATLGFYRRWRRTREINGEQLKARFKNTVLRPNSIMPQPTPLIISALQQQQQAQATAPPLPSSIMPQPTPFDNQRTSTTTAT